MEQPTLHHYSPNSFPARRRERSGGEAGKGRGGGGVGESDAKDEDADRLSAPSISCKPPALPLEADGESSSLRWVAFWCKSHARLMRSDLRICGPISVVFRMVDDNMQVFFSPYFRWTHFSRLIISVGLYARGQGAYRENESPIKM